MTKWFEVKVTMTRVFAVEVGDDKSAEDARQCARDEVGNFDATTCSAEITGETEIGQLKRYADTILIADA